MRPQSSDNRVHQSSRHHFTLIELLVVVAIIAILASLLLPALASARGKAMRTKCLNNQKQVAMGLMTYANDFDDFMPPADVQTDATGMVWQDAVHELEGLDAAVMQCPAGRKKWGTASSHYWHYSINFGAVRLHRLINSSGEDFWYHRTSNADVGGKSAGGTRIGNWLNPSNLILIADGADQNHVGMINSTNTFGSAQWGMVQGGQEVRFGFTHNGHCVFSIADGSARDMRLRDTYHGPKDQMWFNSEDAYATLPQSTWNTIMTSEAPPFVY